MEGNTPVLQCRALSRIYRIEDTKVVACDRIDLEVMQGEIVAIVGTSGSGKSTLLYLLAGIERASSGEISILGSRIDGMSENELVKFRLKNVGFIFQAFNLMHYQSALENVALPLMLRGVPRQTRLKAAARMLKTVGLGSRAMHKPAQMSGGQQQRVSIARALVSRPRIIFADEPTGNLDSHTGEEVMQLLTQEVREYGSTLIMVTHDMEKAKYADKIVKIADGKITEIITGGERK